MRIGIVGSRKFKDRTLFNHIFTDIVYDSIHKDYELIIISGGAVGPDTWAEEQAGVYKLKTVIHDANWDIYGKSASYIRNQKIINDSEKILAFWDGSSTGTKHSIDLALKKGIPVNIYIRK